MKPRRFLIEGLDHDDAWIMVEDEFYAVAQSYTQHLHYAEYVRRKKEAKAQNATAIGEIERPTDGRTAMPKDLQQKKEAEALAARQKEGLEQFAGQGDDDNSDDDDDDDDDVWAGSHLHGLMTSPRKLRSLPGVHARKSTTRAAAGFGQTSGSNGPSQMLGGALSAPLSSGTGARRNEADELTASSEDDDLEEQTQAVTTPSARRVESKAPASSSRQMRPFTQRGNGRSSVSTVEKREPPAQTSHKPRREFKSRVQMLFDDLDELPEQSRSNSFISDKRNEPSTAHKTPEPGTGDRNLNPRQSRYKDVPTFLI